ncbi:hypothetical protein EIN_444290, partial [Entamoeba invadens IP1]
MTILSSHDLEIISQFLNNFDDYKNLTMVCKKFTMLTNPYSINTINAFNSNFLFPHSPPNKTQPNSQLKINMSSNIKTEIPKIENSNPKFAHQTTDNPKYLIPTNLGQKLEKSKNDKDEEIFELTTNLINSTQQTTIIDLTQTNGVDTKSGSFTITKPCYTLNSPELKNNPNLFIYVVQSHIQKIPKSCFENCVNLKNIALSCNLTKICDFAFCGCKSIERLCFPTKVQSIGSNCFMDCISLRSVTLPVSLTQIKKCAFCNCKKMTRLKLSDRIVDIGNNAFKDCRRLKEVVLPPNLNQVSSHCFENCEQLSFVYLPLNINLLQKKAFAGCKSLQL